MSLQQALKNQVIKLSFLRKGKKASVAALQLSFHRTVCDSGPDANPEKLQSPSPCTILKGLIAIPVGNWLPSLVVPTASTVQVRTLTVHSTSTARAHTLTIVAWQDQRGGIRLDFCVRGYTNRGVSYCNPRHLQKKASWWLTLTGTRYLWAGLSHHTALHLPRYTLCHKKRTQFNLL